MVTTVPFSISISDILSRLRFVRRPRPAPVASAFVPQCHPFRPTAPGKTVAPLLIAAALLLLFSLPAVTPYHHLLLHPFRTTHHPNTTNNHTILHSNHPSSSTSTITIAATTAVALVFFISITAVLASLPFHTQAQHSQQSPTFPFSALIALPLAAVAAIMSRNNAKMQRRKDAKRQRTTENKRAAAQNNNNHSNKHQHNKQHANVKKMKTHLVIPDTSSPATAAQRLGMLRDPALPTPIPRGLQNLGNTCYFNSVMQNLARVTTLRDHFLGTAPAPEEGPMTAALRAFLIAMWDMDNVHTNNASSSANQNNNSNHSYRHSYNSNRNNNPTLNPSKLLDEVGIVNSAFAGRSQHDAHELMRVVFDAVVEEEKTRLKKVARGLLPPSAVDPNAVIDDAMLDAGRQLQLQQRKKEHNDECNDNGDDEGRPVNESSTAAVADMEREASEQETECGSDIGNDDMDHNGHMNGPQICDSSNGHGGSGHFKDDSSDGDSSSCEPPSTIHLPPPPEDPSTRPYDVQPLLVLDPHEFKDNASATSSALNGVDLHLHTNGVADVAQQSQQQDRSDDVDDRKDVISLPNGPCQETVSSSSPSVKNEKLAPIPPEKLRTIIDETVGGLLTSTIFCRTCKSKSSVYEPFFDLQLPLVPKDEADAKRDDEAKTAAKASKGKAGRKANKGNANKGSNQHNSSIANTSSIATSATPPPPPTIETVSPSNGVNGQQSIVPSSAPPPPPPLPPPPPPPSRKGNCVVTVQQEGFNDLMAELRNSKLRERADSNTEAEKLNKPEGASFHNDAYASASFFRYDDEPGDHVDDNATPVTERSVVIYQGPQPEPPTTVCSSVAANDNSKQQEFQGSSFDALDRERMSSTLNDVQVDSDDEGVFVQSLFDSDVDDDDSGGMTPKQEDRDSDDNNDDADRAALEDVNGMTAFSTNQSAHSAQSSTSTAAGSSSSAGGAASSSSSAAAVAISNSNNNTSTTNTVGPVASSSSSAIIATTASGRNRSLTRRTTRNSGGNSFLNMFGFGSSAAAPYGYRSVLASLEEFTKAEVLEDDNAYGCEECTRRKKVEIALQRKREAAARNGCAPASVASNLKKMKSGCHANGNIVGGDFSNQVDGCENGIVALAVNGDGNNCASTTCVEPDGHHQTSEDGVPHPQQQARPQAGSITKTGTAATARTGSGDSATSNATSLSKTTSSEEHVLMSSPVTSSESSSGVSSEDENNDELVIEEEAVTASTPDATTSTQGQGHEPTAVAHPSGIVNAPNAQANNSNCNVVRAMSRETEDLLIKEHGVEDIEVVRTTAEKRMMIKNPPRVLALQLKRFNQYGFRGTLRKMTGHIEFPSTLDLAPFVDRPVEPSASANAGYAPANASTDASADSPTLPDNLTYILTGIAVHTGSLHGGHYYAYVRHDVGRQQDKSKNGGGDCQGPSECAVDDAAASATNGEAASSDTSSTSTNDVDSSSVADGNGSDSAMAPKDIKREQQQQTERVRDDGNKNGDGNVDKAHPDDRGGWFLCNDSNVSRVSEDEVLSSEAYLLIYERINV